MENKQRLLSLDLVRGITVAGMILVNNGYTGSFEALQHAKWNGLSLSDFVFPFFLFIMGVSMYLAFSKRGFTLTGKTFWKVVKRSALLLILGVAINWLDMAIWGNGLNLQELRFWAVLQRIAICYFVVSLFVLTVNHRFVLPTTVLLLIAYAIILFLGNGYSQEASDNILHTVDAYIFGEAHLYHKSAVDPEGLVSTMSSLANVLLGFYCGMKIHKANNVRDKLVSLFFIGSIIVAAGFIVNFAMPVNKRIWSPSFALATSGACCLLLAVMMKLVDADKKKGAWVTFFNVFGVNALALYISSELMAIIFGRIGVSEWIYNALAAVIHVPQLTSLAYAIVFVLMNFAIGYPLWRKRIYIKL